MVITILMITMMMKMITMIVMIMIMMAVVIKQLYVTQCNLGEPEITAGHRSMTRRKRSMAESNFLQVIHYFLNPTTTA